MKTLRCTTVLIPVLFVALTGCGSSTTTSGGEADVPTSASVVEMTTPDASAPDSEPAATPAPVATSPVTTPPATTPPATTPATTTPPTAPPTTTQPPTPPVKNPPVMTLPTPKFNSFGVSAAAPCVEGEPAEQVTVSWDVSGATSIYVAIDNEFGPYEQNLPASGSLAVPGAACNDTQTYFVVAENALGRTVKQETRVGV